jgi:cell division protein FtsB
MLQSAKKELAAARKLRKHGKITTDELFDYEWRVTELEQEIKDLKDLKDFTDNENV